MTRPIGWSAEVGVRPFRVIAEERRDRRGRVYLRWWAGTNWTTRTTGLTVTTPAGRLAPRKVAAVMAALTAKHRELASGTTVEVAAPLTIRQGLDLAVDAKRGKYPTDSMHRREVDRELKRAALILGDTMTWDALRPGDLRALYRARVKALQMKGHGGRRGAEVTIARLLAVAEWLRGEGAISPAACRAPKDWKQVLGGEVHGVTVHQPRHTLEEMRAILTAAPQVDPRLALAYRVGIGLRLGQVIRTPRSALDLDAGTIRVPGRGKKQGALVVLLPEDVAVVRQALTGFLALLERAFLGGTITDYPLFPSGQLTGGRKGEGVARLEQVVEGPVTMTAVRKWFRAAEKLAQVPHVAGRSTYGIKRQAVDAGKAMKLSRDGLTKLGGWADPQMADRVYADVDALAAATEAAVARRGIRGVDFGNQGER